MAAQYNTVWKNFYGEDYDNLVGILYKTMKKQGMTVRKLEGRESFMVMSGSDATAFEVTSCEMPYIILVQRAKADPITNLFLSFVTNKGSFKGLSYIMIRPYGKKNKEELAKLFNAVRKQTAKEPWDVRHHHRMKNAWILRWHIKRGWEKFLGIRSK